MKEFESNNRLFDLGGLIADMLPSGSGFDGSWTVQQRANGLILASNSYTCYTECGTVDAYADFTLHIRLVNCELHIYKYVFNGAKAQYLARKYELRQWFDDVFFCSIHDAIQYNISDFTLRDNL